MRPRRIQVERLADRYLLAGDLRNSYQPLDVNDDLIVSAMDALQVIQWLDRESHVMPPLPDGQPCFADVNGDGKVTAADALANENNPRQGAG